MSTDPPPEPEPEPDDADNQIFFPGPSGSHHCTHWPLRPPDPQPELGEADQFVEVDPTGRYGRYRDVLGKGAFKKVYKAFDELEGIEVAWNQVRVADVLRNSEDIDRLYSEVHLLKTLKHKNIIKFYNSWVDNKRDNSINFITEVFTSGTLSQYRRKHKHVDIRALKNWSRQILSGLQYLHSHDPPVIHRDLKCDNIFVNGNQGEVKIGDLGLAAILRHAHIAHSVIGTPEFMAPELYEEEYNELVDIYAFGMCLLELVTFEYPYSECSTTAQIYKKVMSGVKPASLSKVTDPAVKEFIEKCISNASERLPARDLLRDPFLQVESRNESVGHPSCSDLNLQDNLGCSDPSTGILFNTETYMNGRSDASTGNLDNTDTCMNGRDFTVEGQRKDINTIFLKLRIADLTGQFRNIHFPFDIEADTSISVATEMVSELDLTDQDVTAIAEIIDAEIQAHVPEWVGAFEDDHGNQTTVQENDDLEAEDDLYSLQNESNPLTCGFVLEQLSSGRKYWSDSPRGTSIGSPRPAHSHLSSELNSHGADCFSVDFCEKAENSPDGEDRDGYSSHDPSSSNPRKSPHFIDPGGDNSEVVTSSDPLKFRCESPEAIFDHNQSEASGCPQSGSGHADKNDGHADKNDGSTEYTEKKLLGKESESFKFVTEKLKHLLVEQQKELSSLRKKHDMSISDVLKELPPELCRTTLNMFGLKVPDYVVHSELEVHSGPSTVYSTPRLTK